MSSAAAAAAQQGVAAAQQQQRLLSASLLEIERDRLLTSLSHLERSVVELKAAQAQDPDPEYKAAISENLVVIAKKRARVACLEDEIKRAKGEHVADITHSQLAAVPVSDEAPPSQQRQQQRQQVAGDAADMDVDAAEGGGGGGGQPGANTAASQQQQQQQPQQQAAGGGADGMWL